MSGPKALLRPSNGRMSTIYVLQLRQGKYYVGRTNSVARRMQQHAHGIGSAWTAKYRPVKLLKTYRSSSPFDEDKYTKIWMHRRGVANVRGGAYVRIRLPDYQLKSIEEELRNAVGSCFQCGKFGHFSDRCSS